MQLSKFTKKIATSLKLIAYIAKHSNSGILLHKLRDIMHLHEHPLTFISIPSEIPLLS